MRKAFVEHARVLAHSILRMPPDSFATRFMIVQAVFFISGAMHIIALRISIRCGGKHLLIYYCGAGTVTILEHLVQRLYRQYQGIGPREDSGKLYPYWKILGYLWVIIFHVWTTPKIVYPIMTCPYL